MFNGTVSAFRKCICDRLEPSGFLNHGTSWIRKRKKCTRYARGKFNTHWATPDTTVLLRLRFERHRL